MKKLFILCVTLCCAVSVFAQAGSNLIGSTGDIAVGATSVVSSSGYSTITVNNATNGGVFNFKRNGSLLSQYWADQNGSYLFSNTGLGLFFFTDGNLKMTLLPNGSLGIGYSTTPSRLEVTQPVGNGASGTFHLSGAQSWGHVLTLVTNSTTGDDARMLFSYRGASKQWGLGGYSGTSATTARFSIWEDAGDGIYGTNGFGTERFTVLPGGKVGIGTSIPDQMLTVMGTIHAKAVTIDLSVPGPDYVFDKSYKLRPLSQLSSFIAINKHLPEIPSANAMKINGVDVNKLNMKLLKKVEELTLYLIEKDKKENQQKITNKRLIEKLANQDKQLKTQELRLAILEKQINSLTIKH